MIASTRATTSPGDATGRSLARSEPTAEWEAWLGEHHSSTPDSVCLKYAKKAPGLATMSYAEAVEVALCYGWIDGQAAPVDETWWLQMFTPRRARSQWSKISQLGAGLSRLANPAVGGAAVTEAA